ncbi:hypothetical protein VspSTUT16_46440 [Vibrio sp. STUT-A16]|nr:hypothetical protein VspSTUT16_46440 [Vibrio sp. STUT-A16]GAJ77802.1 hypothetical protein JCM18905_3712 [Vibrio sp. JCM 18905]
MYRVLTKMLLCLIHWNLTHFEILSLKTRFYKNNNAENGIGFGVCYHIGSVVNHAEDKGWL